MKMLLAAALCLPSFLSLGCDDGNGQVPVVGADAVNSCGTAVCAAGQVCLDPANGTCGSGTPRGVTDCGSQQCPAGQYCAVIQLEVCENGCLTDNNCLDNQTCVIDSIQNLGVCQNVAPTPDATGDATSETGTPDAGPDAPAPTACEAACADAQVCGLFDSASSALCKSFCAQVTSEEQALVVGCADASGCSAELPFCFGLECGGSFACDPGLECNDGLCSQVGCVPQCAGKFCGDNGCGGTCGQCFPGDTCNAAGECVPDTCIPDCFGKTCGSDGCGGTCGACLSGEACDTDGQCGPGSCVPACAQAECGDDGCGGSCGTCASGQTCNGAGMCVDPVCVPDCSQVQCGDDGCGASCGTCVSGQTCNGAGMCVDPVCVPDCSQAQCGDDGCGGSCGSCSGNTACNGATGQCECAPACDGKQCGDDGCGATCGPGCSASESCVPATGQCEAVGPACDIVGGFENGAVDFAEETPSNVTTGFYSTSTPEDGLPFDYAQVEFWFPSLDVLPTVFDLSVPTGWADCTACVIVAADCSLSKTPACSGSTTYFATAGLVTVLQYGLAGEILEYSVSDLVLQEAVLDPETYTSTLVPGGATWCLPGTINSPPTVVQDGN